MGTQQSEQNAKHSKSWNKVVYPIKEDFTTSKIKRRQKASSHMPIQEESRQLP